MTVRRRPALSRRDLLTGAAALAVMPALSACSRDGQSSPRGAVVDRSTQEPVVTWASWPLYIDVDRASQASPTVQTFEQTALISVAYQPMIDDNQAYADSVKERLRTGRGIGADLIVVTDWLAARLIQQGSAQRLDKANVPMAANLAPRLASVEFDQHRDYSLPWQTGYTGIAYHRSKVDSPVRTVADLWRSDLKGRVQVLTEMRDTMGLIMLDQGADITGDFGSEQWGVALEQLERQLNNGQIRRASGSSYTADLVSGEALACMAWSGDIRQLNELYGDQWEFVLPEGGATLWTDSLLVPAGATHKGNAEILMNYYYDPAVAAQVAAYVQYISPVTGAQEAMRKLDSALAADPLLFPSEADLDAASTFRTLAPAEDDLFSAQFEKVLGV
jgi:spermidine/putrescine transport system substrate-binding protein